MEYTRIDRSTVMIGGETYKLHEPNASRKADRVFTSDPRKRIEMLLRENGTMTFGVIVNRCRKLGHGKAEEILSQMIRDRIVDCTISVHPRRKSFVYHYSITTP